MLELIHRLDYIPLSISQAAAFISRKMPRATISTYLEDLKKSDQDMAELPMVLSESATESHRERKRPNSIVETWQLPFQYVRKVKPSVARFLSLMSLFDRQEIPEKLLAGQYNEKDVRISLTPEASMYCM
jgi:hypothetical protein